MKSIMRFLFVEKRSEGVAETFECEDCGAFEREIMLAKVHEDAEEEEFPDFAWPIQALSLLEGP